LVSPACLEASARTPARVRDTGRRFILDGSRRVAVRRESKSTGARRVSNANAGIAPFARCPRAKRRDYFGGAASVVVESLVLVVDSSVVTVAESGLFVEPSLCVVSFEVHVRLMMASEVPSFFARSLVTQRCMLLSLVETTGGSSAQLAALAAARPSVSATVIGLIIEVSSGDWFGH
jgi:hypothetical protein